MDSVDVIEETFEYVSKWTMRFGKHRVVFSEVPVDYLKWCYKNGVIKNERVEGYLEELFGE